MRCTDVARAAIADRNIQELHRLAKLYPRAVPKYAPVEVREAIERARRNANGPDP